MSPTVTPNEIAKQLGVSGLTFRNWLRAEKERGHVLLAGHEYRARYVFTAAEAEQLAHEFTAAGQSGATVRRRPARVSAPHRKPKNSQPAAAVTSHVRSADRGHRVTVDWMGQPVQTLEDLLRPGLRAVAVGINPAPKSVASGHYYQGTYGQRFFSRLAQAGLLPDGEGFEDDRAFASGIGFTDVVKRPTAGAGEVRAAELEHGRAVLVAKLERLDVPVLIFVFKQSANTLLGALPSGFYGLVPRRRLGSARLFVMPGPTAPHEVATDAVGKLGTLLRGS